ncbi:uncharacterized protein DUF3164 [Elizabethkingia miricola]|uniref:Uncharacterized protein DUF3164 n=1 Tax=Elizabethkingia miricola TaxID=172045 RepID=A0ABY3NBE1_ELIMR|nr:DUF3164 family protein [Elizabethkingia miricola]TYO83764.1 uncharacterized protein DUF3164 [Elizabethkingia miricola]
MTTIDFNALTAEQRAELLKNIPADELKASIQAQTKQKDEDRKAYKEIVNEAVPQIVQVAKNLSTMLSQGKFDIFNSLRFLLDQKAEVFEIKQGQQSHTFSDDKGNGITYGYRSIDGWDDTVNAGIDIINEVIESFATDEKSAKLVTVINKLLKKDAKGNLKSSRVLELQQLADELAIERFTDGVNIIKNAYRPVRSAFFIESWYTNAQGKKEYYPLSISSVDFPEGTIIEDLFPIENTEENVSE